MTETALRFTTDVLHPNITNNILASFRAKGYAVIPDVFVRDSVDAYLDAVRGQLVVDEATGKKRMPLDVPEAVAPLLAPKVRALLPGVFSPYSMANLPSVHEVAWLIKPGGAEPNDSDGWHKDRGHEGAPGGYSYPLDVHVGMYFRDMTLADGPTQVVPGSHMDPSLTPQTGPVESFLARKQDVVLWDQRLWHRGSPRTAEGDRIFALYGFYPLPRFLTGQPVQMPKSLAALWDTATDPQDRLYYGGIWTRSVSPDRSRFWNWQGD